MLGEFNDNFHVITGGVDIAEFPELSRKARGKDEKIRILMSGRADDPRKGFGILIKAGKILWEKRQDFEICVTVQGAFIEEFLKPLGWLTHEELREEYKKADLVIVPSIWEEPFGIVAVEAGALSLPVISTRVGGLQEIVEDGITGFVIQPQDEKALADKINYFLDDREKLIEMGKSARKRVIENYNWDDIVNKHYPAIFNQ
ncbi:glycosyltransferase family 4 protein [bacterium]|nr:glycosyltransferase family 4 protein [bacterium]